ncbi:MAG: hypothetical protein CMJ64_01445 [Planctomycetaceae bacterium]|nr:hypothetical protein [Planctomycetaceae bacterium]
MFVTSRVWLIYTLLLVMAIPWYWRFLPSAMTIVSGVPAWVFSSLLFSAAISAYTAWLLREPWPSETTAEASDE